MELGAAHTYDSVPKVKLSDANMIKYRDERKNLRFTLTNGETLQGAVRWFDEGAIHIVTSDRDEITLLKHAVLYYSVA